tara:strand:+ start:2751 stop:3395 length:645 start_codon:yes stop_codon:yes gene_type:complete
MPLNFSGIFPPSRELNVNFDWVDIASSTGYVLYDGFNAYSTGGDNYVLVESSKSSALTGIDETTSSSTVNYSEITGNSGQSFDGDFDLTQFQLPQTIEGDAFVRVSMAAGGAQVAGFVLTAHIRKWDGSTETNIANTVTDTFTMAVDTDYTRTLAITIPRTHFKKGDILRLTILITTSDTDVYDLAHNPNDSAIRSFVANNSRLSLAIPYKINV